jgi:tyrosinase
MAIRVRRDVSTLDPWDDSLVWYAKAVAEMRKRPIADPTSWRYQAAIHDYIRDEDPYAEPSDVLPSDAEQEKFWRQCQHFSWFFLPWHRWYLLYFEAIVGATIVQLGGPAGWALPYWNYSGEQPASRILHPAFRAETLPDGSPNALFIPFPDRENGNDGEPVGDRRDVSLRCLRSRRFQNTPAVDGFGGPKTGFNHDLPEGLGTLENTPHGSMHVAVNGFMGAFNKAGLDPIFWMHHCNIDRLWVVWRDMNATHTDPTDPDWLADVSFDFHDATGAVVTKTAAGAVDTKAIGYEYEPTPEEAPALLGAEGPVEEVPMAERVPEMVGATEQPTPLTTAPTTANVAVSAPTGPGLLAAEEGPQRTFIRIENVTGRGRPRRYSVYVNDVFAGIIPLFGVSEATRATEKHGGGGLHYRLDVTEAVDQLKAEGKWDEANVKVTFVPDEKRVAKEPAVLSALGEEEAPKFQVGRVSVFVA